MYTTNTGQVTLVRSGQVNGVHGREQVF